MCAYGQCLAFSPLGLHHHMGHCRLTTYAGLAWESVRLTTSDDLTGANILQRFNRIPARKPLVHRFWSGINQANAMQYYIKDTE